MTQLTSRKKLAYTLVLLGFFWLLVELVCLGALWFLDRYKNVEYKPALVQALSDKHRGALTAHLSGRPSYVTFDPVLGWTVRPNGKKPTYRANSVGIRSQREYALEPAPGIVRIAAFGDSFTHCDGMKAGWTWQEVLEGSDPRLEVMNFGVPGYEPGQAFLRYQQLGPRFHPQIVLIGFMSENISRVVNAYRPFYFPRSGIPFSKPRFGLEGGKLVLYENPIRSAEGYKELLEHPEAVLPRLGEHDYFYRFNSRRSRFDFLPSVRFAHIIETQYFHQPIVKNGAYNTESEAFQVTVRVLAEFYNRALADGSLPIIVLFPDRQDIRSHRRGEPLVYQPLTDLLHHEGYRTIDLIEGIERYDTKNEMVDLKYIHYPRVGNAMVARYLHDVLEKEGLTTPEGVERAKAEERLRRPL
ncbi:MAG TPA: SGNH/GDSL hydrolase family protein [Thermoanaerobaculia bacterium]|nr:SGNH/GDSL hydrolase family protein [Thermoanaerobaculia bacterium]